MRLNLPLARAAASSSQLASGDLFDPTKSGGQKLNLLAQKPGHHKLTFAKPVWALLAFLSPTVLGCQVLVGIDGTATEAIDSGKGDTTIGSDTASDTPEEVVVDAPDLTCKLPPTGDANARIANLVPSTERYDFCFKRTDGAASDKPLLASSGGACPKGLLYKDVSAAFALTAGTYEVKVVKGGANCASTPIASVAGVSIETGTTTTIALLGDGAASFQVKGFRENQASGLSSKLRFIHASSALGNLDLGIADKPQAPAKIVTKFFSNIPFATTSPAGSSPAGTIDASGYIDLTASGINLPLGVALGPSTDALNVLPSKMTAKGGYTLYTVGKGSTDPRFPLELYFCDERQTDGIFSRCANALPVDLTVDVFNTQLNGAFAALEGVRKAPLIAALGKLNSDLACITEVWTDEDKKAIIEATKARYPYSVTFPSTLDTPPVDDPTNEKGVIPPLPKDPPCAGVNADAFKEVITCLQANCSTKPTEDGRVIDEPSECLSSKCLGALSPLVFGDTDAKNCWNCGLTQFFSRQTWADAKKQCLTDPRIPFGFKGSNGVVMISRFPLDRPDITMLPASQFRVGVLKAGVTLEGGAKLDAYCTVMTTPAVGGTRPYTGLYGGSATTGEEQWRAELLLQSQKLIDLVAKKSGKSRALVMGDFYTGPEIKGSLTGLNVESFNRLTNALPIASAPDYSPKCTFCADNPISTPPGTSPTGSSSWGSYALLSNIAVTDVRSNEVILKDPTITYKAYKVPLSPYYGMRTVVRIRP